jgi:hypothetical protein
MKRKILLSLVCSLMLSGTLFAQEIVKESCLMTGEPALSESKLNKKQTQQGWFHYVTNASNAGISWTRITNASLFPDTLVYQRYGGGTAATLGRVGTHSVGAIFDPKDIVFSNPTFLSKFNPYRWDSLAIMFRYSHNIPGTVDTLIINLFNQNNITLSALSGSGRKVATVSYDKLKNESTGYAKQIKVLIDAEDSTSFANTADYNVKTIAIPGGLNINEGGMCGYTLTYVPGYRYANGDTLQQDWIVPPVKKLNHFIYASWRDNSKLFNTGYNSGLKAITASRYTSDVWNGRYIPGHAWNDYDEIVNSYFYISTQNYSVQNSFKSLKIHPNPVRIGETMHVSDDFLGFTAEIFDLNGRLSQRIYLERNQFTVEVPAGIYFIKISKEGISSAIVRWVVQP